MTGVQTCALPIYFASTFYEYEITSFFSSRAQISISSNSASHSNKLLPSNEFSDFDKGNQARARAHTHKHTYRLMLSAKTSSRTLWQAGLFLSRRCLTLRVFRSHDDEHKRERERRQLRQIFTLHPDERKIYDRVSEGNEFVSSRIALVIVK